MAGTTSLLRSAQATRNKVQAYNDSVKAFEWNLSNKSEDDYREYANYLADRAKTSDPSKALSYQRTLVSARRTYVSHEIQRATIDVLEGRSNLQTKYNYMVGLYQASIENDDLDLAQSLRLQLDNLDRSLQAQSERSARTARTMASLQATTIEDAINKIRNERGFYAATDENGNQFTVPTLKELSALYQDPDDGGEEGINRLAQQMAAYRPDGSQANFWDIAQQTIENVAEMYQNAAEVAGTNTSQGRTLLNKAKNVLDGQTNFDFAPGLGGLTYNDVKQAVEASRAGQNLFVPAIKNGKPAFEKTKVVDYVWGRDENGKYKLIEVRDQLGDFGGEARQRVAVIDKDGNQKYVDWGSDEAKSYLERAGIQVVGTGDNGVLQVRALSGLGIPQISAGESFEAVIGRDGNLRLRGVGDSIFDLLVSEDGNVQAKQITGDEDVSIFGEQGLGEFGRATDQGIALTKQLIGQDQVEVGDFNFRGVANTAEFNDPNRVFSDFNTTDVLSRGQEIAQLQDVNFSNNELSLNFANKSLFASADLQRRINQAATRLQQAAAPQETATPQRTASPSLQATPTFNLNQTPMPRGTKLRVAPAPIRTAPIPTAPAPAETRKVVAAPLPSYNKPISVGF